MADVGDGLCFSIRTISRNFIQIDCGSVQGSEIALAGLKRICDYYFETPDIFILSHFHIDHYNGLLFLSNNKLRYKYFLPFEIREVYFPKIPKFRQNIEFIEALFAINLLTFGNETGLMEYDFLKSISRINRISFKYIPLSQGDKININGSVFEVIWPPKQITEGKTLKTIEKALNDFKKALKKYEKLKELYQRIREEGVFEDYLKVEGGEGRYRYDSFNYDRNKQNEYTEKLKKSKITLPTVVKKANDSLKRAANHLSLAFFEDNRILFMGDLENYVIQQVIKYLEKNNRKNFLIFIPPHHGTHWHKDMKKIEWYFLLCSNGPKLCGKMNPNFKSSFSLSTHINGDIVISMPVPVRSPWWWRWYW